MRLGRRFKDKQAARWYRVAADQNGAQNNLVVRQRRGVTQDDALSVFWYAQAAEQGHALAQYSLGGMYGCRRGVPRYCARLYVDAAGCRRR